MIFNSNSLLLLFETFARLPSAGLIEEEIQSQHQVAAPNGDLDRAVRAAGAASIESATPDQFMAAFSSLLVRYPPSQRRTLVAGAMRARPDLADRIQLRPGGCTQRGATTGKTQKIIKSTKARKLRFQSRVRRQINSRRRTYSLRSLHKLIRLKNRQDNVD